MKEYIWLASKSSTDYELGLSFLSLSLFIRSIITIIVIIIIIIQIIIILIVVIIILV